MQPIGPCIKDSVGLIFMRNLSFTKKIHIKGMWKYYTSDKNQYI